WYGRCNCVGQLPKTQIDETGSKRNTRSLPGEALSAWRSTMPAKTDRNGLTAGLAADVLSPDRTPNELAIFSAPGVEVVLHWWVESNRRWAERDRAKARMTHPVAPYGERLDR